MEKYIGGVKLNYDNYPGKDYYSDGSIEDVLLDIVKNPLIISSVLGIIL